jgi:hypothetical protein
MRQVTRILKILSCTTLKQEDYQEKELELPLIFPDKQMNLKEAI